MKTNVLLGIIFLIGLSLRLWGIPLNFSILFGSLTIILLSLTARKLTNNRFIGLFSGLALCLMPWHIQASRESVFPIITAFTAISVIFVLTKLFESKKISQKLFIILALVTILLTNISTFNLNALSLSFLGSYTQVGYFGLVLAIIGLIEFAGRLNGKNNLFVYWLVLAPGKTIVLPLSVFIGYGVKKFFNINNKRLRLPALAAIFLIYLFQLIYYLELYHYH